MFLQRVCRVPNQSKPNLYKQSAHLPILCNYSLLPSLLPPILRTCEEIVTISTLSRCRLVCRVCGYDNNPPRPKDTAHMYIVYMGVTEVLKIASVNWKMERCGLVMWKTSILLNGRSCRWKPSPSGKTENCIHKD